MAGTRSEIEQNMKNINQSYEERVKLRKELRSRLNLPKPPPSFMTFDHYHDLVPVTQPLKPDIEEVKAGQNVIKLDDMQIEVSNEIMAMIYYRALKDKFEDDSQGAMINLANKKVSDERSNSIGSRDSAFRQIGLKQKSPESTKKSEFIAIVDRANDDDIDDDLANSGSETDISTFDLGLTREMKIRSLQVKRKHFWIKF